MQGDEIWYDGRPRWLAGHLPFVELWPRGVAHGPKSKKNLVTHIS